MKNGNGKIKTPVHTKNGRVTNAAQPDMRGLIRNLVMTRTALLQSLLEGSRRDIDKECDYPLYISIEQYLAMYKRVGIARRVVSCLPDESWIVEPDIYESEDSKETEFEAAWTNLLRAVPEDFDSDQLYEHCSPVFHFMHRVDELSGIGRFGVLFLGLDDGEELSQPALPGDNKLLYLRAFDEQVVRIQNRESDKTNPRYGKPTLYSIDFKEEDPSGTGGEINTLNVHWTRVIHVADNRRRSEIYGTPRMEPVYNNLLDIRKILGGSAEMFWQGAFPGLSFEAHPDADLATMTVDQDSLKEQVEAYVNGLQRYLAVEGLQTKSLSPQVASPAGHLDVQMDAIAITLQIPKRILFGSEQAQLASSQDSRTWAKRIGRRHENYLTPMVLRPFIDRLIWLGVLPEPKEYFVYWPDLFAPSDMEKADLAMKKTAAMAQYVAGGVEQIMPVPIWLTQVLELEQEQVDEIVEEAMAAMQSEERLTLPLPGEEAPAEGEEEDSAKKKEEEEPVENYSEDQPRDDDGKWSDTGGGGSGGGKLEAAVSKARQDVVESGLSGKVDERLIFLSPEGEVVGDTTGSAMFGVDIPPAVKEILKDSKSSLWATHNHPRGQSLSVGDISQFAQHPGLKRLEAVTHDKTVFSAERGPNYPKTLDSMKKTYTKTYDEARESLLKSRDRGEINQDDVDFLVDHAVAMSLFSKGIIKYGVKPSPEKASYFAAREKQLSAAVKAGSKTIRVRSTVTENQEYKYSSVLFQLPKIVGDKIQSWGKRHIADDELCDDGEHGRETDPHVTVLYGLAPTNAEEVGGLIEDFGPFTITLGKVSRFADDERYDVLKIDVQSSDLRRLRKLVATLPNKQTHAQYRPHVTVAYIKKGELPELVGTDEFDGLEVEVSEVQFSDVEGDKTPITLNFDPDQPRDDDGKWSETGAGGGGSEETRELIGEIAAEALKDYTGAAYKVLNKGLRSGDIKKNDHRVFNVMRAAADLPAVRKGTTVYRGIPASKAAKLMKAEGTSKTFVDKAFVSTSKSFVTATNFGRPQTAGKIVVLEIKDKAGLGRVVGKLSQNAHEKEVLYPPGTTIRVTGWSIRNIGLGEVKVIKAEIH